jgi:fatty acid-binding protein DegV
MPYALAYSGLSDEFLQKYITDSKNLWADKCQTLPVYMIGSTIGTHIGPNGIAVAFYGKD